MKLPIPTVSPSSMNQAAGTTSPPKLLDVLIVGGGLSGLAVAKGLTTGGLSPVTWNLLEARPVLGGRLSNDLYHDQIDLGGAWLWPRQQPVVQSFLANEKDVSTFPQPDDPSSLRIKGGAVQMIHTLVKSIAGASRCVEDADNSTDLSSSNDGRIHLNAPVKSCRLESSATENKSRVVVVVETVDGRVFRAQKVVFAVPPKLMEKHITFDPPLSKSKRAAMAAQHTWMAGVTKVALVYPNRFWSLEYSNFGLPSSYSSPAFQVYDSGTVDGSIHALTFFAHVKTNDHFGSHIDKADATLARQVADQMALAWKSLGKPEYAKQAHSYSSYHVKRWPMERYISEDDRPASIRPHPSPIQALSTVEWDGALHFCGTETDQQSPGVIAGALGSAHRVLRALESHVAKLHRGTVSADAASVEQGPMDQTEEECASAADF